MIFTYQIAVSIPLVFLNAPTSSVQLFNAVHLNLGYLADTKHHLRKRPNAPYFN